MGDQYDSDEGCMMYHTCSTFTMRKGVLYINIMPNGETEALLAFVVPTVHQCTALNGMH